MTGFRVAWDGAQGRYGVRPDITALGKVVGGGLPVGAYGGPRALLERMAPAGDVYQAGTLSGNPLAMAAGLATLRALRADEGAFDRLEVPRGAPRGGPAARGRPGQRDDRHRPRGLDADRLLPRRGAARLRRGRRRATRPASRASTTRSSTVA